MLTRVTILLSILGLALPAATFAQGFTQGDKDLLLSGSGTSSSDFDNNVFSIAGSLGYFFTDRIEGLIRQDVLFADAEGSGSNWNGATRVALDYHFDMGRVWPFIGVTLGYIYGDQVNDTWMAGPEGGVKVFVNDTTYILGMIEYDFFFDDSNNIEDAFDDGRFVYLLGIGFRW